MGLSVEYQNLALAIFERAFDDYAYLRKNGARKAWIKDGGKFSIVEIGKFLRGEWGSALLKGLNVDVTGAELVSMLKEQYT